MSLSGDGKALSFFLNESVQHRKHENNFIHCYNCQSTIYVNNVTEGKIENIYMPLYLNYYWFCFMQSHKQQNIYNVENR